MPLAGGEKGHLELRSSRKVGGKQPGEESGGQPSSPGWKKPPLSLSLGLPQPEGWRTGHRPSLSPLGQVIHNHMEVRDEAGVWVEERSI